MPSDPNTEKLLNSDRKSDVNGNEHGLHQEMGSRLHVGRIMFTRQQTAEYSWGWRSFRPKFMQWINNPIGFMVFLCIFGNIQGMATNTFVSQALPTLERRFGFSSKETGFIPSSNDITATLLVAAVSFYGGSGNRPLWIGVGSIVTGLGTLIFMLPQGLIGPYIPPELSSGNSLVCQTRINSTADESICGSASSSSSGLYYFIFVLGQLITGVGATPLHTLGPAYLDDNVSSKSIGLYLGVFYLTVFLGPGIGSMVGGNLLGIFIDINPPPGPPITPADPRWMGAWWLGPLGSGVILILVGFVLVGFPRKLPSAHTVEKERKKKFTAVEKKSLKNKLKEIFPATKSLLSNPVYICQNLAVTASVFSWMGIGPFMFKIIRSRYGASPVVTGICAAIIVIGGCGLGMFTGGIIVKVRNITGSKRAAKYTFFLQILGVWSMWTFLIPGCSYTPYAGIDVPYRNSTLQQSGGMLMSSCNTHCHCSTAQFRPVCGPDGVTYYSPCFAGCSSSLGPKGFTNCTCARPLSSNSFTLPQSPKTAGGILLQNGPCVKDCKNLYLFVAGLLITAMFSLVNAVPSKITSLRCVSDEERAYGLGIQFIFMRLLGSLPGPIIVGYIIDHTCTLWKTVCGKHANCLNYDYERLGWIIVYYGVPTQVLSLLFFFLSWYFTKSDSAKEVTSVSGCKVEIVMETKPVLEDYEHDNKDEAPDQLNGHV